LSFLFEPRISTSSHWYLNVGYIDTMPGSF
jgi:hypothetical protein